MFCKYCGVEISQDDAFCKHCGKKVIEQNENKSKTYDGKVKKYPNCEEKLVEFDEEKFMDEDEFDNEEIDEDEVVKKVKVKVKARQATGVAISLGKALTNYAKKATSDFIEKSQDDIHRLNSNVKQEKNQNLITVKNDEFEIDYDELKKKLKILKEMKEEGLLNIEEYEKKRNEVLGKTKEPENSITKALELAKSRPKVRKCPNCGEILNIFDSKCSTCGYEISEIENSNSMKRFQEELAKFEYIKEKSLKDILLGSDDGIRIDYDKKCEFIRNYIVPRTKEDSIEFAILAKSNIEIKLYHKTLFNQYCGCRNENDYQRRKKLSDAWWSMLQQIFDKAKIVFSDDESTYKKIEQLYDEVYNKIK